MAGLNTLPTARQQLASIAWLRGRLFVNAFKRKGGKGELIARILLMPFMILLAFGPILGAGFAGYFVVANQKLHYLTWLLWAIFLVWQSLSISTKAAAPSFDLGMLIRFPLRFSTYLLIRLLFGLLDTPTVICSLALLSTAIGIGVARSSLFLPAALILLLLDVTILFFFRMIFLWFDRWFAQRKTREVLIGLFFVAMLGFQYLNVTINGGNNTHATPEARARHAQRMAFAKKMVHTASPVLAVLPPGLAGTAITSIAESRPSGAAKPILLIAIFGAMFLRLFSRRLRGEFHGESFSETSARPTSIPEPTARATTAPAPVLQATTASTPAKSLLSPTITACIGKEIRYLKRSGPLLLALISPVFMVFIIVSRSGFTRHSGDWLLPTTLAYVLLGLTQGMYNVLGTDGPGVHLFFLAPIRLRDVMLAKNIVGLTLIAIEVAIASAIVLSTAAVPPVPILCATYLWLIFTVALNVTMGNIRSIYSPRLIDLGKFRQGKQGQLNALIGLGVLLLALALGAGVLFLATHLHTPWLSTGVFALLAALAVFFYILNLNHLEQIALDRREIITAELCKS